MALGGSRGQAIVLDNPRDPLAIYQGTQNQRALQDYRQQQLALHQQKQQDAETGKMLQYKYTDGPDLFKQYVAGVVADSQNKTFNILQSNPDKDSLTLKYMINQPRSEAEKKIGAAKEVSTLFENALQAANTPGIDQIKYKDNLGRLLRQDPTTMNRDLIQNFAGLPINYDTNGMIATTMKDIKDQLNVDTQGKIQNSELGQFMTITNNKKRFKDMDKAIDFVLGGNDVTPFGQSQQAIGNKIADGLLAEIAQEQTGSQDPEVVHNRFQQLNALYDKQPSTPEERLQRDRLDEDIRGRVRSRLEQMDQTSKGIKIEKMGSFPKGGDAVTPEDLQDRVQTIQSILKPTKNGQFTDEARVAVSRLRGGKLGGHPILQADLRPSGRVLTPEGQQKWEDFILNNKPLTEDLSKYTKEVTHKGVIQVQIGTTTDPDTGKEVAGQTINIDLSNPGAESILNSILTASGSEKKIKYPDLLKYKKGQPVPQGGGSDDEEPLY